MSHATWFFPVMNQIAARHPRDFLNAMTTIHPWWHNRGFGFIGFLTFHKEVILACRRSLASVAAGDFFPAPLANMTPAYDTAQLDSINDLNFFSRQIQAWHNDVHRSPQFPPGFMDPTRNIFMRPFWQFHHFIDQKFDQALRRAGYVDYDDFLERGGNLHITV